MIDMLLDVGQTSSRARLVQDGRVTADLNTLPGFVSGRDVRSTVESSVALAAQALEAHRIDRIAAGCSGLFGALPSIDGLGERLNARHGTTLLRIADDGVTAFLGALDGTPGAMAAAGTGLVAFAVGPDGAARADGVGPMLGDNGSGWWIGRAGLIAALSASDGRAGGSLRLLNAAVRRYGPIRSIPRTIASSGTPIATTAAFAVDVAHAARDGDAVAGAVWKDAARHIGDAVTAVAARAGLIGDFAWSVTGRIAESRDLLEPTLTDRVRSRFPDAVWTPAAADPGSGIEHFLRLSTLAPYGDLVAEYVPPAATLA